MDWGLSRKQRGCGPPGTAPWKTHGARQLQCAVGSDVTDTASVAVRGGGRSRVLSGVQMLLPPFAHGLWRPRVCPVQAEEKAPLCGAHVYTPETLSG